MALDPSIPLSVRPPQIEAPLQGAGGLMQIAGSIGQMALTQQRVRQAAAETANIEAQADLRNRDLADANAIQEAWKDPNAARALMTGDFSPIAGKVQPKTLEGLTKALDEHRKSLLANTASQNSIRSEALGELAKTAAGLKSLVGEDGKPNLEAINAALPEALERLHAAGVIKNAGITEDLPKKINDISELDHFLAASGALKESIDQVLGQQKTAGEIKHQAAQTSELAASQALKEAQAPGARATSQIEQFKADAMKNMAANPGAVLESFDRIIPGRNSADAAANRAFKEDFQAKMKMGDFEGARGVLDRAAGYAAEIAKETNPAVIQSRINQRVQEQVQLAKLSPDAFAGIADPYTRHQAEQKYYADSKAYADKVGEAAALQATIRAAQGGNQAAPALISVQELKQFISRPNISELRAVSGAGSLYQRVLGYLGGAAEGQPIPPQILKDTYELADVAKQSAKRTYDFERKVNAKAHGIDESKLPAVDLGEDAHGGAAAKIRARDPQGNLHEAAAGTPLPEGWKLEK